jgi:hypothetical protein
MPAVDADDDDERMVEDLLMGTGPTSPSLTGGASSHCYTSISSNDPSSFATSDPFYLAMLAQQQQQQQQTASSPIAAGFFATAAAARSAQPSPFAMRAHHHQSYHPYHSPQRQQSAFGAFPQTMPQSTALFAFDG